MLGNVARVGHGSTSAPDDHAGKLAYWASAGDVVVATAFPHSTTGTPGGTADGIVAAACRADKSAVKCAPWRTIGSVSARPSEW